MTLTNSILIEREKEIQILEDLIADAGNEKGNTIIVNGQAGMGKSVLAEKFKLLAAKNGFGILTGSADAHTLRPFHIFSEVFKDIGQEPLLRDTEHTGFTKVFAVNKAGTLVADASPVDDDLDSDIFAGMLSAVQNFVRDSFDSSGSQSAGLGRLEYGDMKIIIENGQNVFLTAVISGEEHQNMKNSLRLAVNDIEDKYGHIISEWKGNMDDIKPIAEIVDSLVDTKFLVRRNLEGVKLDAERLRISDSVLDSLSSMAESKKLAIVLEDIHWADESSQFVLEYLARNILDKKIIILATLRTEEVQAVQEMLDKMEEENICQKITLEKLGKSDIMTIVNGRFENHGLEDKFIEQLESQCEGNPFFIQEMLNHMVQENVISLVEGQHFLTQENYSIPRNIEEVIHRRLDLLEPNAMAIAEFISCIGREFDMEIPMITEMIIDPKTALQKLEGAGIILDGQFSHALFQEVIYRGINQRWQAVYHKDIGEIYERLYDSNDVTYELARHFSRSREARKGFEYCSSAGEKAEVSLAPEQAAEYYELAIGCLKNMRGSAPEQEMELLTRLGDVYSLIGECDKALERYDSAIVIGKQPKEKVSLHRKKAMAYERKAEYENCEKEAEKGLALLGDDITVETIQLLIAQAAVAIRTGGPDKAIELALKALAHAKSWGDNRLTGNALHTLGSIYLVKGDFGNSIKIMEEAIKTRELVGDKAAMAGSLNNLGVSYYYSGKVKEALECFEDCFEAYSKVGDKYGMAAALNNLGGFTQDLGDLEKALDYHKQSIKIKKAIGDKYGVASSLTNMGIVHRRLGDYEKALELHMEGLALATEISNAKEIIININNLGEAYLEVGELDKALEKYEEGIEASKEAGDVHQESHAIRGIAKVQIEKFNGQEAIDYAKKSLDIALETKNTGEEWRSRYILGSAYRIHGEFDRAQEELNKSTQILQETGSGESDPTIMFEEALLYRDIGKKEEAKKKFLDSRESYESKGYAMLVKKIDEELEKL